MKFRSAQLNFLCRLIPVIVAVCSVFPALAQDVAEEPAQSVLKEEPSAEEPNEFTPPAITLGSAAGENPGEFAFKPSTFEGIVPGISKMAEVTEKLGDPRAKIETNGSQVLVYSMEPYDRVGIVIKNDLADSIHLHFKQPAELKQLITEMGLVENTAVTQETTSDKAFLLVWPEQGVTFHFKRNEDIDQVSQQAARSARDNQERTEYQLERMSESLDNMSGLLSEDERPRETAEEQEPPMRQQDC